jgi:hypothetical protein
VPSDRCSSSRPPGPGAAPPHGDGQRNPQDINDAALAAAVYLCSGTDDLSASAGQSTAVYRYNHSSAYVATVLSVMRAYLAGDYTAAPNYTIPGTYFEPDPVPAAQPRHHKARHRTEHPSPGTATGGSTHSAAPATPAPSASSGGGSGSPSVPKPPKATHTVPSVPVASAVTQPVVDVLDAGEALVLCSQQIAAIPDPLGLLKGAKQACADKVTGKTKSAALATIPNTLNGVLAWLGL